MSPDKGETPAVNIILAVVVILLYGNTLTGGFVWDDMLFSANQIYWNFDFSKIFLSLSNGLEYQPIRDLSYLFDIAVWKGSPFGFHLTNLTLFVAIVILVNKTAANIASFMVPPDYRSPNWFISALTALIFAVHPLKCEVVAWITQRNTLIATLCFLLSLLFFLRYQDNNDNKLLTFSLGSFVLAIFSKAVVVTLPLLLLFFMLLRKRSEWRRRSFWLPLTPFIAVSGAGALLHVAIARSTTVISPAYYGSLGERLAVAVQIPFFYLKKSLLPTDISAFYAENFSQSLTSAKFLISLLLLVAMVAVAWLLRKRYPEFILGGGWFAITLLPVSNLLATSPVVADRYLFLPSFGLAFTAASLISRIRLPTKVLIPVILLLSSFPAQRTFLQNRVWHDDISLWSHTVSRSPQVAGVWFNLGRAWQRTPQLSMALNAYLCALKLDPADIRPLDNAATLFPSSRGSLVARHMLVKSLVEQISPYPAGLSLIGYTDSEWQYPDAAEELFLNLLSADNQSISLKLALANLYRKLGAFDRAAAIYSEIAAGGRGRGEAEFGLAAIAAAAGEKGEQLRLVAVAKSKGGVPDGLLQRYSN